MPSSTDTARAELAALQSATLASIIAGEHADGGWMSEHLLRPHPVILEHSLRSVHGHNLCEAAQLFFPKFVAHADITDWGTLSPHNPTTASRTERLEHYATLALSRAAHPGLQDAVRIEWAEARARQHSPWAVPDLVAAVRAMDALEFDDLGRHAADFGSFVRLHTTWFDVHWIQGHRPTDAAVFGPPRRVFFFTDSEGSPRSVVFETLDALAVTLCFG